MRYGRHNPNGYFGYGATRSGAQPKPATVAIDTHSASNYIHNAVAVLQGLSAGSGPITNNATANSIMGTLSEALSFLNDSNAALGYLNQALSQLNAFVAQMQRVNPAIAGQIQQAVTLTQLAIQSIHPVAAAPQRPLGTPSASQQVAARQAAPTASALILNGVGLLGVAVGSAPAQLRPQIQQAITIAQGLVVGQPGASSQLQHAISLVSFSGGAHNAQSSGAFSQYVQTAIGYWQQALPLLATSAATPVRGPGMAGPPYSAQSPEAIINVVIGGLKTLAAGAANGTPANTVLFGAITGLTIVAGAITNGTAPPATITQLQNIISALQQYSGPILVLANGTAITGLIGRLQQALSLLQAPSSATTPAPALPPAATPAPTPSIPGFVPLPAPPAAPGAPVTPGGFTPGATPTSPPNPLPPVPQPPISISNSSSSTSAPSSPITTPGPVNVGTSPTPTTTAPTTPSNTGLYLGVGAGLLAAGAIVYVVTRKRRRSRR